MQTFMPFSNYEKSLSILDKKRLQKQAIETSQILDILLDLPTKSGKKRKGWLKHPALIMWANNTGSLFDYFLTNVEECKKRQIKTEYCEQKILIYEKFKLDSIKPIWLGDEEIHASHRSRLLQKGFEEKYKYGDRGNATINWYSSFEWNEMSDPEFFTKEYYWPINITQSSYDKEHRVSKDALKLKHNLIQAFGANPWA